MKKITFKAGDRRFPSHPHLMSYHAGQRFIYNNTTYKIKRVTDTALEIGCNANQSLWVAIAEFEKLLGTNGRSGLFRWQAMVVRI